MRLWSLHPKYLDTKGLLAVWREGLLAKKVLQGKTQGYKEHPQLRRFKNHPQPLQAINLYLTQIFDESKNRGYNFNQSKIRKISSKIDQITITKDQLEYEFNHLLKKLKQRSPISYKTTKNTKYIEVHPIFKVIPGKIELWEVIVKPKSR